LLDQGLGQVDLGVHGHFVVRAEFLAVNLILAAKVFLGGSVLAEGAIGVSDRPSNGGFERRVRPEPVASFFRRAVEGRAQGEVAIQVSSRRRLAQQVVQQKAVDGPGHFDRRPGGLGFGFGPLLGAPGTVALSSRFEKAARAAISFSSWPRNSASPPQAKAVFTVKLPERLIARVRRQAHRQGQPISDWVGEALEAFLTRNRRGG